MRQLNDDVDDDDDDNVVDDDVDDDDDNQRTEAKRLHCPTNWSFLYIKTEIEAKRNFPIFYLDANQSLTVRVERQCLVFEKQVTVF